MLLNFRSTPLDPHLVLILQRILPPYRLAFFQSLARSPKLTLTLAYGEASQNSALTSIPPPPGIPTTTIKNFYWGIDETIVLQVGSLSLLHANRYDTVIAEFNPRILSNVLACFAARRRGLKFIWWGHGFRPKSGPVAQLIYLWLAAHAHAVIFYTSEGAKKMIKRGMPQEKAFIAWNSIDTEEILRLKQEFVPDQRPRILCIGRLIPEKKVDLLLRGFALAVPRISAAARLTIIGDGPQREPLGRLAEQLGIAERVDFIKGTYEQKQLAPYFNTSSISVSAGYVGLSAIHSLAYGIPMIIADKEPHSPEIAAIEDGVNAVFFQAGQADGLADQIVDLLCAPTRLRQMSQSAQTSVLRKFSLAAMVLAMEQAIQYAHETP